MANRPYVDFAEIKQKVSLPEVLQVFGIADQFQSRGENKLQGVCPLPAHHHGPSPNPEQFKIDFKEGVWLWHCFGDCGCGGDVIEFVKAMTGYDDAHVRFWFSEKFGSRLTLSKPGKKAKEALKPAGGGVPSPPVSGKASPPASPAITTGEGKPLRPLRFVLTLSTHVPYLYDRGLQPETIKRYGLGLCTKGVLEGYIALPVHGHPHEPGTNPVGYLGRWPGEDYDEAKGKPRYKWPKEFPKSQVVYGLPQALEGTERKPLLVCEGPFDVFALVQAGYPAAVAIFGSCLSDAQAVLLASLGRPLVLLFDGDEAGQTGMRQAAAKLITRAFVRVVKLEEEQQPDRLSAAQLQALLSFLS